MIEKGDILIIEFKNRMALLIPSIVLTSVSFILIFAMEMSIPIKMFSFLISHFVINHLLAKFRFIPIGNLLLDDENIYLEYKNKLLSRKLSIASYKLVIRSPNLTEKLERFGTFIKYSTLRFTNYDELRFDHIVADSENIYIKIMNKQAFEILKSKSIHLEIIDYSPFTGPN